MMTMGCGWEGDRVRTCANPLLYKSNENTGKNDQSRHFRISGTSPKTTIRGVFIQDKLLNLGQDGQFRGVFTCLFPSPLRSSRLRGRLGNEMPSWGKPAARWPPTGQAWLPENCHYSNCVWLPEDPRISLVFF